MRGVMVMGRSSALAFPDVVAAGQAAWDAAKDDRGDPDLRMDRASRWHLAFGWEIDFAAFGFSVREVTDALSGYPYARKKLLAELPDLGVAFEPESECFRNWAVDDLSGFRYADQWVFASWIRD
jgi:hypothetical protein